MRLICFFTFFIFFSGIVYAQVNQSPEQLVGDLMESISERDINLNNHSQIFDDMIDLYEHPIDINIVSKQDLEKLIFLSDIQIINTIEFIKNNSPVTSKFQLQGIKGMSLNNIKNLLLFVRIGDEYESAHKYRKLNGQLIFRDQFDIEIAKGYLPAATSSRYYGNRHHLYSKVQAQLGKNIFAGVTMDKDPGETIFRKKHKSVDFVSMHLMYHGNKFLKTLIVGDFHANFGQGLALWSGTGMGKTSEPLQIRKRGEGFKKYTSANEHSFFRGIAATMQMRNIEVSVFVSQKTRDASLMYDTISSKAIVLSLPKTGYHRTETEVSNRNRLKQKTFGGNVNYRYRNLSVSAGGYCHHYQADSIVIKQLYQQLASPEVQSNHYWLSYNYGHNRLITFGEVAVTSQGYAAIINGLQFNPSNNVSLALVHRYFSSKYFSVWTNAFTEYSSPSGESGFYLGLTMFPLPKSKISGYVDVFKNNWLKYNLDKPSSGYEISLQGDYSFSNRFAAYLRYREKEKAKNQNTELMSQYYTTKSNTKKIRLHTSFLVSENWSLQMRIEKSYYREKGHDLSEGMLSFVGFKYVTNNKRLACWARYTVFDTDDYDTRIYVYENDLLYNFYTPSFQGEGTRMYFQCRVELFKNVKFWCKAGQTWYSDKTEIGSGLQTIKSNVRTNIRMQLQIKF